MEPVHYPLLFKMALKTGRLIEESTEASVSALVARMHSLSPEQLRDQFLGLGQTNQAELAAQLKNSEALSNTVRVLAHICTENSSNLE